MKKYEKQNIAISAIWYERYLECSRTYMTPVFHDSVMRFYLSLLDIDDNDKAVWTKVNKYYKDVWLPKVKHQVEINTGDTYDEGIIQEEYKIVRSQFVDELFRFIIQTIQDSGVGWELMQRGVGYDISTKYRDDFEGTS